MTSRQEDIEPHRVVKCPSHMAAFDSEVTYGSEVNLLLWNCISLGKRIKKE